MNENTRVTIHSRSEVLIDNRDIVTLPCVVNAIKRATEKGLKVKSVNVHFTVPGGGDWSNMDAPVDAKHPVTVVIEAEGESQQ